MAPKTALLCEKLRATSALLASAGESYWAAWMDKSLARLENGDFSGISHQLSAYGGMGSFNDLILMSVNGPVVADEDYRTINTQLDALRSEIYALARAIRNDAKIVE